MVNQYNNIEAWRKEIIISAFKYADVKWEACEKNTFHGLDSDGVMVNTPDITYSSKVYNCGWWKPNQINTGMVYSWGGCTTIDEFQDEINEGKYVGNVPDVRDKRRSQKCVGVDCSGLVTICWKLNKKASTKTIALVSTKLESLEVLKSGDVILKPGSHVMIFSKYLDNKNKTAEIIDASRSTGRVLVRSVELEDLSVDGYDGYQKNQA